MLVLSRKIGEEVVIGHQVRVKVVAVHGRRVRLAISAPESIPIHRAEIAEQRLEFELTPPTTIVTLPKSA